MHYLFNNIFYLPLYNGLIFFIDIIPFHNVGLVVVLFTCFIKIILFPLSQRAIKTQFEMKKIETEINDMKLKYKDDKKAQAEKTMQLYKDRGINPFAGIFLMLIQLPVLMALYFVFLHGGFPNVNHADLYSFTLFPSPEAIGMTFLGVNVAEKSIIFALLAAITQFFQMQITIPKTAAKKGDNKGAPVFKDELARSMNMQMKYIMPVIIFFIAKNFAVVVSLYLITSSIFAIGQELYMKRKNNLTKI